MESLGVRRALWLALVAALTGGGSHLSLAQSVSGTSLGFAAPNGFSIAISGEASWQRLSPVAYGQEFVSANNTVVRNLIDESGSDSAFKPSVAIAYGLPNEPVRSSL